MSPASAIVAFLLLGPGASALDPPASITNVRVELRAGDTPTAALEQARRDRTTTWVGWSVKAVPKASDVCCFNDGFKRRGCSLAERESSWGTSDRDGYDVSNGLYVLVETKDGAVRRVKVVSSDCPVDGGDRRLVWLGAADPGASLVALMHLLEETRNEDVEESALVAVAFHGDPRADVAIEKRALDRSLPAKAREQAVFWAGQARGETGFRLLSRVLTEEPSADLRQHAVFALSQSSVAEAPERIKRVAVEDRSADVRSHALFSLSQTHAKDAGAWIVSRLDAEHDDRVREQAVFALSQLNDGTDWLLVVLHSKRDRETIRRALFWLGQSNDPRALEELEKILDPA